MKRVLKSSWMQRRHFCMSVLATGAQMRPAFAEGTSAPPVTVKVPVASGIDRTGKFAGFRFEFTRSTRKGESTEYYRLSVKELSNGDLQFHRRNDNGVAGSGVLATVKFEKEEGPTEVSMLFQQVSTSSYQEGLFLKKAVPAFSLKDLLLEGAIQLQLEVDSDYPVESVRANFQRLASLSNSPGGRETYRLSLPSSQQYMSVQFFPYRSGSKTTVSAVITGRETSPDVIDFVKLSEEVRSAVRAVVNA